MKQFTLKDFISYNNPCFSCGEKVKLSIVTAKYTNLDQRARLRPLVSIDGTMVDLEITYSKTLQLYIEHQTNKITTSNIEKFKEYLQSHKLYLETYCKNCQTNVESFFLDFDLKRNYLKPISICYEHLCISDQHNIYYIKSHVFDNVTDITVIGKSTKHETVNIKTPLLLLGKFKTKEKWIDKLKTYLIFS